MVTRHKRLEKRRLNTAFTTDEAGKSFPYNLYQEHSSGEIELTSWHYFQRIAVLGVPR